MNHKNLECYDNYEIFSNLLSEQQYRDSKLKGCSKQIEFIIKLVNQSKIKVVELGSGNSKILYGLSMASVISEGYGLEISESRHYFAEKWKKDLQIKNVENIKSNFLELKKFRLDNVDLFLVLDLAFQFCEPIETNSEVKLLSQIYNSLTKNGKLILELDGCKKNIESIKFGGKTWEEFNISDPWQYSLWDCNLDIEKSFLTLNKTFINRNSNLKDFSSVILKLYKKEEIKNLLLSVGFKKIDFYQNWGGHSMENDDSEFIIVAEK